MSKKYKLAFTLCEILIVIGIIGIIAELTIPAIMQITHEAEIKSALRVAYSELSQASTMAATDNGGTFVNLWSAAYDNVALKNVMSGYLKTIKDCGGTPGSIGSTNSPMTNGCWITSTSMDGTISTAYNSYAGVILTNGMYVVFRAHHPDCITDGSCGWAVVDVNGSRGPNKLGKDSFYFYFKQNGAVGIGGDTGSFFTCTGSETGISSGWGCTAKYLYN